MRRLFLVLLVKQSTKSGYSFYKNLMTRFDFQLRLNAASYMSFKYSQKYLTDSLISQFVYTIDIPNDRTSEDSLSSLEVSDLLVKDGKVPIWIDISVVKCDKKITTLRLLCSDYYTSDMKDLYYHHLGVAPFGIKSPDLPSDYKAGEKLKL